MLEAPSTSPSRELSLRDLLSRLRFEQACKLLGPEGGRLIREGGARELDLDDQVRLTGEFFRLRLPDAIVTIRRRSDSPSKLAWDCSACARACEHVGAAFALLLEEKTALGLAAPPSERPPIESLGEDELVRQALAERRERARSERMRVVPADASRPWTDYQVTNHASGKTYRVALRGAERGESYCSCPDFRTNTLGTCKHVEHVLRVARRRFSAARLKQAYRRKHIAVHLRYGSEVELRLLLPAGLEAVAERLVRPLADRPITDVEDLLRRIRRLERVGREVTIYPDAEEYIQAQLFQSRVADLVAAIRRNPARHPLRKELLATELLPYQLDGIAFAIGAGRAVLADDMGLGKTIQGIGVAELLARVAGIRRVLIVCPASIKSQWRTEIERFSRRSVRLVLGGAAERAREYENECFFTVCNYEQVLRDVLAIERVAWDLIVLDEGQRIKNWEARTSRVMKSLRSRFALVLSGTPLENRLEELHSVVEFVEDTRLGPHFRFHNRHRVVDERGRVLGYKNLAELRARLAPVLLRRTRAEVLEQLPARHTEVVRVEPTDEQLELHGAHMRVVSSIVRKPYLTEMDLLRLRKALLLCRLAANGTFLVDKKRPGYSSKLERLDELLEQVFAQENRKAVLFSEWTGMLDAIEPLLAKRRLGFVRLDGGVPQKKRQSLVATFRRDPTCRLFLTTNAGSTGLNLQAADTVLNVDLPWNPAILEQRIGRAHRMGQKRPVQVFLLVTEGTLEEGLLGTLSAKQELFLAALDPDSSVDTVDLVSGAEELRRRLEVLLGRAPDAPLDESMRLRGEQAALDLEERRRVSAAGGELLTAAFRFLGQMLPAESQVPVAATRALHERLARGLQTDEQGRPTLTVSFPDRAAFDALAESLARLLSVRT